MTTQLWEIGLVVASTLLGAGGPIFLKKGMNSIKKLSLKTILLSWKLYLGIGIYGLSYLISIPAFKGGDISILYPFIAISYIWVCLFSVKFLNENMNIIKWLGIIAIIIGVSFIGYSM